MAVELPSYTDTLVQNSNGDMKQIRQAQEDFSTDGPNGIPPYTMSYLPINCPALSASTKWLAAVSVTKMGGGSSEVMSTNQRSDVPGS